MIIKVMNILLYVIMFLFGAVLTSISPMLIEITKEFSLSLAKSGLVFTFFNIGFLTFILVGGVLSEKLNKKNVISIALIGFTIFLFLIPISPSYIIICIALFFCGGFGGILESLSCALLAELNIHNPDYYINMSTVYFGIGALLGPIVTGLVLSLEIEWKIFYYIMSVLSLITTCIFISIKVSNLSKSEGLNFSLIGKYFKNINLLLICICMAFYTGSEVGAWGWMSTFLKNELNFSVFNSGLAVAVFWACVTAGRFLCGLLLKKYTIKRILMILSFFASIVTFICGKVSNNIAVFIVIAAMGFAYSSIWPLIVSYGSNVIGTSSGTVFAMIVGSGSAGSAIIPYIMGSVGEISTLRMSLTIPALLFAFIVLIIWFQNTSNEHLKSKINISS